MKAEKRQYRRPWPKGVETRITKDSPAHVDGLEEAVDICLPEGTPISAAADGLVFSVKDDSYEGGMDEKYRLDSVGEQKFTNEIIILHPNADQTRFIEFTQYAHNKGGSAYVKPGDIVHAGQHITDVGSTGYSSEPHLHFMVGKLEKANTPSGIQSLEVEFVE